MAFLASNSLSSSKRASLFTVSWGISVTRTALERGGVAVNSKR